MLVFQDAMKKPEPPKEFDEELVLAKVGRNSYDEYLKLRFNIWFQIHAIYHQATHMILDREKSQVLSSTSRRAKNDFRTYNIQQVNLNWCHISSLWCIICTCARIIVCKYTARSLYISGNLQRRVKIFKDRHLV